MNEVREFLLQKCCRSEFEDVASLMRFMSRKMGEILTNSLIAEAHRNSELISRMELWKDMVERLWKVVDDECFKIHGCPLKRT